MNTKKEYQQGVAFAILCAVLWGILPVYWKALVPINPVAILFYRIVLAFGFSLILALCFYRWKGIVKPLKEKGILRTFFLAGTIISFNWGIYIWAVSNNYVIQACIGYYIEPLIVCVFGILFFKERMNKYKLTAFLMACAGVLVILVYYRQVPVLALSLALTFATYAAIKKKYKLDAVLALLYETMLLVPFAVAAILYFELTGRGAFGAPPFQIGLLLSAGILTGTPLMLFAMATNRISLITLGITEYIAPSLTLLLGIFVFQEPFDKIQLVAFIIIWVGLVIFTFGEIKESRESAARRPEDGSSREYESAVSDIGRGIKRLSGGAGGDSILIAGSEKTALIDCGMAYCGEALAEKIKQELGDRPLDYVILTHSHYDHISGLPYLRKAWPGLIAYGSSYGKYVLERDSARKKIEEMSESAWKTYCGEVPEQGVLMEGLKIDRTVGEQDVIALGDRELHVYETPGHTSCSLTFLLEPDSILFPSETIGVYAGKGVMVTGMVKSCRETMDSIEKCRKINAKRIVSPHFGLVPDQESGSYWDLAAESVIRNLEFVRNQLREGTCFEEIMEKYEREFYSDRVAGEQPKEAFLLNARHMIRGLIRDMEECS